MNMVSVYFIVEISMMTKLGSMVEIIYFVTKSKGAFYYFLAIYIIYYSFIPPYIKCKHQERLYL